MIECRPSKAEFITKTAWEVFLFSFVFLLFPMVSPKTYVSDLSISHALNTIIIDFKPSRQLTQCC